MPNQYALVKDLPDAVRTALASVKYGRKDIVVYASSQVTLSSGGEKGCRAFVTLVNLTTGAAQTMFGSWGGANMFSPRNAVDNDDRPYPMPPNGVIISGSYGGGRPVYASLHVAASMVDRMLPAPGPELTLAEAKCLTAFHSYKSSYRKDCLARARIGADVVDGLVARGFLARNKAGATSITTAGKNARAASTHDVGYL